MEGLILGRVVVDERRIVYHVHIELGSSGGMAWDVE